MTIRVAITDDSDLAFEYVRRTLELAPDVKVVGHKRTVEDFLGSRLRRAIDVLVLDLWMPGRVGLGAVRQIARDVPVVVVSDVNEDSPMARECLAQGAHAFISKASLRTAEGSAMLRAAVRAAARKTTHDGPVVAVVGSAGAIGALEKLIPEFDGLEAAFVLVQHMPEGRETSLADRLTSLGLRCQVASHGAMLRSGSALLAPAGRHLLLTRDHRRVVLSRDPPFEGHRPAGTILLRSALPLGSRLVALILSGMGRDGSAAVGDVIRVGGTCIAQHPDDCGVPSMPTAAIEASPATRAVRLNEVGAAIARAVRRARSQPP